MFISIYILQALIKKIPYTYVAENECGMRVEMVIRQDE